MALRVPTVDGPSVEQRPLQGGFQRSLASPDLLAGSARQVADAGKAMQDIGAQLQEREDADLLMRAETEVKVKYLEWEGTAKQRKGQQAWGVAKEAGEWWDKEAAKVGESLTNPRQKHLFGQKVQQMRGLSVGQFAGHEQAERRHSLTESAQASIVGSINMAAANPGNVELLTATRGDIVKRTAMLAQINGWAPEVRDVKQAEYLTNLHKQVIQGLVQHDPGAAESYFLANKAEIDGSQHAEIGDFARKATATRMGESAADAAWQTLGPKGDRDPVQLDKLEESIRKRTDIGDEAKKVAISHLKERTVAFKDARRERDEQLEATVNTAVMKGAGASQIQRMPEFLRMDGEKQRRLMDFIENRALRREQVAAARESRAASAEAREQTRMAREGFGAYLMYSNPDTLRGMSRDQVVNLLPALGNELTGRLMQRWDDLGKPGKIEAARIDEDTFKHIARQIGLPVDKSSPSESDKAVLGELKYRVERVIEAAQQRAGKALPEAEKEALMRTELARTVKVGGWFSNSEVPVIALTPQQKAKVVVPTADRTQILEALRQRYAASPRPEFEPTEANITNTYLLGRSRAARLIPDAK